MRIIFGLGNPGPRYKNNRHNIGCMVVEELGGSFRVRFRKNIKLKAYIGKIKVDREDIILVKPSIFMNNSGICARRVLDNYHTSLDDCLIIYDDADLPLGRMRFRERGSSGGHRGMGSIIDNLESEDLNRLKVGIGRDLKSAELSEYVLSDFSHQEKTALDRVISRAKEAISDWINRGADFVMRKYNRRAR